MPRRRREHLPGGLYHAVLRGNHREAIFSRPNDYQRFEQILAEALDRYGATAFAYCWMTNHVHVAIRVAEAPLGHVMRVVASRYARWRQRPVPTTGHLFERRYHARLVDGDRYLVALVRYIHQNPVRAGMVADPADYCWSSHRAYLDGHAPPWLRIHPVLALLGSSPASALAAYRRLMGEEPTKSERNALALRFAPATAVQALPARTTGEGAGRTLDDIAGAVACEYGLRLDELRSKGRRRRLVDARAEVARLALRENAGNLSAVARYLGRAPSTLSELLRRGGRGELPKP